ncbi:hypothetical protein [Pontibacter pamirensis]|uniref:hypothetical protein n=1 Tax=Pontibacter pamirensis TaxID=2562824 RepID=UPI001389C0FB|nr:hypothetical protein [Pontibacter pamirensis]
MKISKLHPHILLPIYSLVFLAMLLATACKKDEKMPSIAGYYRMESLEADRQVDLNNDGNVSTNAMEQISQSTINTQYNFNHPHSYLEIRPMRHNTQRLSVPFPDPRMTWDNGAVTYLRNGLNGIGYGYSYDEKNKVVHLDRTNVEQQNEELWGKLEDIKVVEKDTLELLVSKNYYDFRTASWIKLQLVGIYARVKN